MEILIFLLLFIFLFLAVLGIYQNFIHGRVQARRQLKKIAEQENMNPYPSVGRKTVIGVGMAGWSRFLEWLVPKGQMLTNIKKQLARAYVSIKPEEYLVLVVTSTIVFGLLAYLLVGQIIFLFLGAAIGSRIPSAVLVSLINKRKKQIGRQLPEALNILSNGLRAGLSLSQSMSVAGREMDKPMSQEMKKIVRDNLVGMEMEEALGAFAERIDDPDIDILITAILIQRQVGGNLAEVLDTISSTIRERIKLSGEVKAMTAQGRISAVIISVIPFGIAMLLYLFNKDFLTLLVSSMTGYVMLAVAALLQGIGIFTLVRMLRIRY